MAERTDEEVASGLLRLQIGGTVKAVPTLKIKQIPEWTRMLDAYTPTRADLPPAEGLTIASVTATDAHLELIVAYDRTGALGGREWLEEHADPAELRAALQAILENVYPKELATLAWTVLGLTIVDAVGLSVRPKSSSGALPTGTKIRTRSVRRSTRSS